MSEPNVDPIEPTDPTVLDSGAEGLDPPADPPVDPDPIDPPAEPRGKDAEITQERFDEIYGRMSRAERALAAKQTKPAEAPKDLTDRPREEDFSNYTDFVDKLTDWKVDQRDANRITETNKQTEENRKKDVQTTFDDNLAAAERANPKFRDEAYLHPDLVQFVYDSDHFAEFGHYFKDNPDEVQRLLSLPTANHAAMEIGKISASFGKPKPRTKTNAPAATKPVGTGAAPEKKDEDKTQDEYMRDRKEKLYPGST